MSSDYPEIEVHIPQVLLPVPQVNLSKWAVIACDQYTSQPEYWQEVENLVGSNPSTLNLVLPEIHLEEPNHRDRIDHIHASMKDYLARGLFSTAAGMVYVERTLGATTRRGLVLGLDLECYDYQPGATSLIRPTEGTIVERLYSRLEVREGAALEIPHVLVLIDDPQHTVIQPISDQRQQLKQLYDFDLMFGSGHLAGWLVDNPAVESAVIQALHLLRKPSIAQQDSSPVDDGFLYAVGDGNHAFAAAKALWDQCKQQPGIQLDHPARYALVEIVNLHDPALRFEPIHRIVFDLQMDVETALTTHFGRSISLIPVLGADPLADMTAQVEQGSFEVHRFGIITSGGISLAEVRHPALNLPVGTVQSFLDWLQAENTSTRIDYVHGLNILHKLGTKPTNAGFYLPSIVKHDLFCTVRRDGALPRKTFSLGEARWKRFYMESRRILT